MPTNPSCARRSISSSSPANRPPRRRLRSRWLALAGLALPALVLAACGGSSSPSTSSAAEEQQQEVKFADFARCLREHGIEAKTAGGPGGEGHGLRVKGNLAPAKMEAAQNACKKYQPAPQKLNLSPQEKVERAEAVEKFAKCMREHGIEVHASSSEGRVSIQIHPGPHAGAPNPESPAFQKAQSSCQRLLPFKGPHGGAPPSKQSRSSQTPDSSSSESSFATGG